MAEFVHEDTGEIEEIPDGIDPLFWAANQCMEAADQEKAWKARGGMLKAALIRGQEEKKAVYGDVAVSIRQTWRDDFEVAGFRDYVADAQLDGGALLALVLAAKGFDRDLLHEPGLADMVARFTGKKPTATFAVCERVRKLRPAVA